MVQYLSNRDCSVYAKGNTNKISETINKAEYKECRETKKKIHKKIIDFTKDSFNCDNIMNLISTEGLSKDVEDNIKYIIYLIQELSNDAESFNIGENEVLYDMVTCFEKNFNPFWNQVEVFLKSNETLDQSIIAIKKDLEILLIQSLVNLVKVLHFEEIDGYISKSVTEAGIMKNKKGEQIYQSIKEFVKHFNEFGPGEYNLSDSIIINVTVNDEYQENKENYRRYLFEENEEEDGEKIEELEHIVKYDDKGIIVILKPKPLMKIANAYSMQIVRYDSPIMPIKTSGNKDDSTLDTFVSITLYDKDGNEINIDDMPENIRPKIIYNRSYHKYLKHCFFYNEAIQDLSEEGIVLKDNVAYEGEKYLQCSSKHLTSFTAGNYYSDEDELDTSTIVLIVLGSVLLLAIIIGVIFYCRKKNNNDIENVKKDYSNMEIMN